MRIVGVSFDSPEHTARWIESQSYPFEVWTDSNRTLALAFGAADDPQANRPARVSVVLDGTGVLRLAYPDVSIGAHPNDVLADVRRLVRTKER